MGNQQETNKVTHFNFLLIKKFSYKKQKEKKTKYMKFTNLPPY